MCAPFKSVPGRSREWIHVALVSMSFLTPLKATDYTAGLSSEWAHTDDILLMDSELVMRRRDAKREVALFVGESDINLDYHPSPKNLLGKDEDLNESKYSALITYREGLDQRLQWNFSGGLYQGFTDYRSVWFDEYYRQLFHAVRGYQDADVGGSNVAIGGRYEYLEASGLINWSVAWQCDDVSPAYEKIIFGPLVRGTDELETWRYGLGSEHVLTSRWRFKQDAAAIDTTDRAWRYTYAAESVVAVTDEWTLRLRVEGAKEAEFHSLLGALLVERDWDARWFAGIALRMYHDNGQIIDPLLVSGASPALDTYQLQLTLRYSGPQATWRLAVGPYLTRYAETTVANEQFAPLYRDRDWLAVQAAWNWKF